MVELLLTGAVRLLMGYRGNIYKLPLPAAVGFLCCYNRGTGSSCENEAKLAAGFLAEVLGTKTKEVVL